MKSAVLKSFIVTSSLRTSSLDHYFTARISDFGLVKILKTDQTPMTGIRGTKGYVAPEWFRSMPVTAKVDVYSYGILLLELICRRRNFEADLEDENQMTLADWAYDCYINRKLDVLVMNDDEALADIKRVEKYVMIAIWCIQENPLLRPTMKKVTQMLEGPLRSQFPRTLHIPTPWESVSVLAVIILSVSYVLLLALVQISP